ncbi:GTPase ObgE [Patescibacteria group bacterium]|nr:GTPase ObgE [Patescibacteria group bacterium]
MFCDYAKIIIIAGKGGDGFVSFRRDALTAKGGPDGGDGGRGGNVLFQIDHNLNTLGQFLRQKKYQAQGGFPGGKNNKKGADGENLIIKIPPGTILSEVDNRGKHIALQDFQKPSTPYLAAKGGVGGFGNTRFKSSVHQRPQIRLLGLPGQKKKIILELKTIADIGLVGLPNSGKSTFLSKVTKARPKIADYPFTTLIPHLGVYAYGDKTITLADIPGLIKGAHQGKGLGFQFLKHIERTRMILHLIDIQSIDPVSDYQSIKQELKKFSPILAKKPEVTCFTKIDTTGWNENNPDLKKYIQDFQQKTKIKKNIFAISSITTLGVKKLMEYLLSQVQRLPAAKLSTIRAISQTNTDVPPVTKPTPNSFRVNHPFAIKYALQADQQSEASMQYFWNKIKKLGLTQQLIDMSIQPKNTIYFGSKRFKWPE